MSSCFNTTFFASFLVTVESLEATFLNNLIIGGLLQPIAQKKRYIVRNGVPVLVCFACSIFTAI